MARCPKSVQQTCVKVAEDVAKLCFDINVKRGIDRLYAKIHCESRIEEDIRKCLEQNCPP
jgi:hypothetical protein